MIRNLIPSIYFLTLSLLVFSGLAVAPAVGQVVINEYTSSNVDQLRDDEGETSDWIELYNAGPAPVELQGWGLSDDPLDPFKWIFPDSYIGPGEYLVIQASGQDKRTFTNERKTLVGNGSQWRYFPANAEPPADWRSPAYDDSAWPVGPSGFGRGDGDDQTQIQVNSVYLRKSFTLTAQQIDGLVTLDFHLDFDDGFVAYLNEVEIDRRNLGKRYSQIPFDTYASAQHEAQLYQSNAIEGTRLENLGELLQPGNNVLTIQVHNHATGADDLSAIPFLTIGTYSTNPSSSVAAGLIFEDPVLHTNFKLSSSGETIVLTEPGGTVADQVDTGRMYANVARGRHPSGTPGQFYLLFPTPGARNTDKAELGFSEQVNVTPESGLFASAVTVSMDHASPGAEIRFTLDGSEPVPTSLLYTGSFTPPGVVGIIRARAFETGLWPSFPTTNTYIVGVSADVPVISLVTDPPNLWDYHTGIYARGPDAWPFWPFLGANFYKPWERPVHLEMIEPDGTLSLKLDAGIMIHGGASRSFSQKSFRILARGGYGPDRMNYRIFPDRGFDFFKRIVLRNGGTDWGEAIMRDGLANVIAHGLNLETTHYRVALVLLNGEYWGIQNLRDRQDKYYLEDKFGVDPDNLDILELDRAVVEGDRDHYDQMMQFIRDNPLYIQANFEHLKTLMDTENFATYFAVQIFFGNTDWPQNNIKYWRERTPEGRWRWMLYDLDAGLTGNIGHDTLSMASSGSGWSTFLFRELLKSAEFAQDFVNRYADMLNTTFLPERTVDILQRLAIEMDPEIDRHFARWDGNRPKWESNLQTMGKFINQRTPFARDHVVGKFNLPGQYELDLQVQPAGAGYLRLTAIDVSDDFHGTYFQGVPVKITAVPSTGYQFDSWSDPLLPSTTEVSIDPSGNYSLTGIFIQTGSAAQIHEVNYKSSDTFDPDDWVELHNNSDQSLDISGWELRDEGNSFTVPGGTVIPPRGYLVLCQNLAPFQALFPNVTNAIGDLGFGLRGTGEELTLLDSAGVLQDQFTYQNQPPWPIPPAGQGPTLELFQPGLDNADGRHWRASLAEHGTPGEVNSVRY